MRQSCRSCQPDAGSGSGEYLNARHARSAVTCPIWDFCGLRDSVSLLPSSSGLQLLQKGAALQPSFSCQRCCRAGAGTVPRPSASRAVNTASHHEFHGSNPQPQLHHAPQYMAYKSPASYLIWKHGNLFPLKEMSSHTSTGKTQRLRAHGANKNLPKAPTSAVSSIPLGCLMNDNLHRITKAGKDLYDPQVQLQPTSTMSTISLSATSPWFLNTSGDRDSPTSQNHRITKVGKDLQDHPVQPFTYYQHFPTEPRPLVAHLRVSWTPPKMVTRPHSGQPVPMLHLSFWEEFFPNIQSEPPLKPSLCISWTCVIPQSRLGRADFGTGAGLEPTVDAPAQHELPTRMLKDGRHQQRCHLPATLIGAEEMQRKIGLWNNSPENSRENRHGAEWIGAQPPQNSHLF